MNFAVPVDHSVKMKVNEKKKVPRPCSRTEKLWNMTATVIPIVFGSLGAVTIELILRLEDLEIRG